MSEVTSVEQLEALPEGAVILGASSKAYQCWDHIGSRLWFNIGAITGINSKEIGYRDELPATVLHPTPQPSTDPVFDASKPAERVVERETPVPIDWQAQPSSDEREALKTALTEGYWQRTGYRATWEHIGPLMDAILAAGFHRTPAPSDEPGPHCPDNCDHWDNATECPWAEDAPSDEDVERYVATEEYRETLEWLVDLGVSRGAADIAIRDVARAAITAMGGATNE